MSPTRTLLVGLAHPDDELIAAGTILAHRARGDRIVLLWLTRGEMTGALGPRSRAEVGRLRTEQGRRAAELLGAAAWFLDFPDTALEATPRAAGRVARVVAEVRPDAVLTWGVGWLRGPRHPDHQACGKIVRDAITLARIERVVRPAAPHRSRVAVFTYRDVHSRLPAVAIDVEPYLDGILELARLYREAIGFGEPEWILGRLRRTGERWGLRYAEEFDAWDTEGGPREALVPAVPIGPPSHPDFGSPSRAVDRDAGSSSR